MTIEKSDRMKELVLMLNNASFAYYGKDEPIMTDKEYDDLYDELSTLELETGTILAGSPTQKVQGFILDGMKKIEHSKPMLSASKTKSVDEIKSFVGTKAYYGSFKLDGLTLVVIYENGVFKQGTTRGNGTIGEDVTEQCRFISNLPMKTAYNGRLELRGECVISWDNFKRINENLEEPYSHPRNLASGTLRQLDLNVVKNRALSYVVFECVSDIGEDSKWDTLNIIEDLGFEVVERRVVNVEGIVEEMKPETYKYPVDGLIFEICSNKESKSMGITSHHECCRMALKWEDSLHETVLKDIEWNTTKTGAVNPVAIFEPVDLDGAVTTRATLHNVSIIEKLKLGVGDTIQVYRSNMVIPKVHDNLTRSNSYELPTKCPCCNGDVEIHNENGSKTLHCINPDCSAKLLSKLVHAVSRNALNIDGLSEATIEKFISLGWLSSIADIYKLRDHADELMELDGFGRTSINNLMLAIDKSTNTTLDRFIYALSIPNIGRTASKAISKHYNGDFDKFIEDTEFMDWTKLDDFGDMMDYQMNHYFLNNKPEVRELAKLFVFEKPKAVVTTDNIKDLSGKTFVITGSLEHFTNREEAKERIELLGGKVSGSVSAKTSYLVNNDVNSTSGKNKKAKELGIPIISEMQLLQMIE